MLAGEMASRERCRFRPECGGIAASGIPSLRKVGKARLLLPNTDLIAPSIGGEVFSPQRRLFTSPLSDLSIIDWGDHARLT